jgi:hypothetical protein
MNLGRGRGFALYTYSKARRVFMAGLAGQRVLVGKCGPDPPNAGHLGGLYSVRYETRSR